MDGEQGRSETMVVERKVPRREEEEEEDERGRLGGRTRAPRRTPTPSVFHESPRSGAFRPRPNNPTLVNTNDNEPYMIVYE